MLINKFDDVIKIQVFFFSRKFSALLSKKLIDELEFDVEVIQKVLSSLKYQIEKRNSKVFNTICLCRWVGLRSLLCISTLYVNEQLEQVFRRDLRFGNNQKLILSPVKCQYYYLEFFFILSRRNLIASLSCEVYNSFCG